MAPCKDCTEREVGCHAHCEKYLDWKHTKDEQREIICKTKTLEGIANGRRNAAIHKMRKHSRYNS